MLIIQQQPDESGAYPPIQSWPGTIPPDGYDVWPDSLETDTFQQYNGFVVLTVVRGMVSSYQPNTEARDKWISENPQPEPEPDVTDTTLDLLADHEYRLCMIELQTGIEPATLSIGGESTMKTVYNLCKLLITSGRTDGLMDKMDVYLAADRLTTDEYSQLVQEMQTESGE